MIAAARSPSSPGRRAAGRNTALLCGGALVAAPGPAEGLSTLMHSGYGRPPTGSWRRAGAEPTYHRGMETSLDPRGDALQPVRVTVNVRGRVQGVGFRWWTRARALELGLSGHARNTADGRVEIVAQGSRGAVERLLGLLAEQPSTTHRPGEVTSVSAPLESPPRPGVSGFVER